MRTIMKVWCLQMTVTPYKNLKKARVLDDMLPFSQGIYNTDAEVPTGFLKLMVNYDFNKDRTGLRPRPGFNTKLDTDLIIEPTPNESYLGKTHFTGQVYIEEEDSEDVYIGDVMLSFGTAESALLKANPNNPLDLAIAKEQLLDLAVLANKKLIETGV